MKNINTRLVKNKFLSEQEAKLAKFCEDNKISFVKQNDASGRGVNSYKFEFKPKFLDETEAHVIRYLEKYGIKYKFAVDDKGIHHYDFDGFVDLGPETPNNAGAIIRAEMPVFKRTYSEEIKATEENDASINELKKEISKLETEVGNLKEETKRNWFQNAWHKTWYYLLRSYRNKIDKEKSDKAKRINTLEDKIRYKKSEILSISAEKKWTKDMLMLAGAFDHLRYQNDDRETVEYKEEQAFGGSF